MRTLVTGASGFIGKNLVNKLHDVVSVVRNNEYKNIANTICIDKLNENTDWKNAFSNINVVIHLAGIAHNRLACQREYRTVNTLGTLHLAREAVKAGVKRFIFVSSIGVNGTATHGSPYSSLSAVHPHDAYSKSKYDAETGLRKIAEETGLEVVIVRPTLVYGAEAPGNFARLTKLVKICPILPFGLANNRRDFIAVQNLTDLLVCCASHPNAAGHTFLASDGEAVSIKQFTNAIAEGLGKKIYQVPIPVSWVLLAGKLIGKTSLFEQLYGDLEVDTYNTQKILGWTPPFKMKKAMSGLKNSHAD